jgi:6-phosphofructokinase 1
VAYLKGKGLEATLKYIDPAYMIRTVPANCYDRKMCASLASNAVHGAMAGFTGFTVGHINDSVAMIPVLSLGRPNRIEKDNRAWQRLLAYTGQPFFQNP